MASDLPLLAAQLGVWYALKAGASSSAYNIAEYVKIFGTIDPDLFETALRRAITEAEAQCVNFRECDDVPRQFTVPLPAHCLTYLDLSFDADPIAAAEAWMRTDLAQPIDLCRGPFFTYALFKIEPNQFVWYTRNHHLVMDGFGAWLISRRVAAVYSALVAGSAADPGQFDSLAALIDEDAAYRISEHFKSDRQFWRDAMADCPEQSMLSIAKSTEALPFLSRVAYLPSAVVLRLEALARQVELSLPQIVTMATAIFIHRLTGAEDVVLGQLMTARMGPISRRTPAMVSNVVPLRLEIRSDMRVEDLAVQLRRKVRAGIRRQRYRIADLRRDLRRVNRPFIKQFVSVRPFTNALQFAGSCSTTHPLSNGPVDDLNIHVIFGQSEHDAWCVEFDANPTLYDRRFLSRLQLRFLQLLEVIDDPAELIGRLDILPPEERRQIVIDWNSTGADYPRDRQVHQLFEEQAARTPDALAVAYERQQLTYRQLNEQADQLAHHLSLLGVGPGERVGLCVERSLGMVVGLLGILKSGGAYVPLDPNYPPDRLAFVLEDSKPLVLLTQQSLRDRLRAGYAEILCLDALPGPPIDALCARATSAQQGNQLAYLLYTSGSTGRPKGVEISHRSLVNFLQAMQHDPGIDRQDRLLSVTSLSFDIAGLEVFLPLIAGAHVTIAPTDVAADGFRLAALMRECSPTIMQATPATWRLLLEAGWEGSGNLKILCGGEAWPPQLADALVPLCASLWNMYGPTETTVWSAVARIAANQPVRIGPPIANTTFYVLDNIGQPVPVGVPGELYIGGDGVARGYHNRPELTKERFVPDPFSNHPVARMYRTGDRVRQLPDGSLEFLGRFDYQVKIRGHRIELGEIEAVLRLHPDVQDSVVVAREDVQGDRRLVAYVTASDPRGVLVSSVRDHLRQKLATYMMPAAVVPLEAFPLTPNGKIDRKALPAPDAGMHRDADDLYVAPRTPLEVLLAGLWRECLQVEQVGIHDDFFDLGGDSLSMLQLSLEIERASGQAFPLPLIYDAPTVARMAMLLEGPKAKSGYSPLVLLRPGTDDSPPVFMVHPVGGSTMQLLPIARSFPGRQAIYGIQARGFDGIEAAKDRVEAMADSYLEAIAEVQPHGPYLLSGMCFGGLVAMEMAHRLSQRGAYVSLLALFDSYPDPRYWPLRFRVNYFYIRRIKELLAGLQTAGRGEVVPYIAAQLKTVSRKVTGRLRRAQSFVRTPESLPPAVKAVLDGGIAALENYRPHYYPGKVSYLMCGYHTYLPDGPRMVWGKLVEQLEVETAPVMMRPEYVGSWLFSRIQSAAERDARPCVREPERSYANLVRVTAAEHI